jgi:hypothetical protein
MTPERKNSCRWGPRRGGLAYEDQMLVRIATVVAIPWLTPLSFGLHAPGWYVGKSGTRHQRFLPHTFSAAWAGNVRCSDCATSDPPNATLRHLPRRGIIVRASIQPPDPTGWPPKGRRLTKSYALKDAYHFACCEAARNIGGEWELYGFGPKHAYSVIVRVYWGSKPTRAMRAAAQRAIGTMRLPAPH